MQPHELNLIVLGDEGVGKSAIVIRRVTGNFVRDYDPTIEDIFRKIIDIDGEQVMLNIFDTGGAETYISMNDSLLKQGDGFIYVYSITNRRNFEGINSYYKRLHKVRDMDSNSHVPIIIVGNKIDLENEREVTFDEGQQLANSWDVDFIECSAKEDINITELFETISFNVMENLPHIVKNKTTSKKRSCLLC
ncbi:small monomeric GTPase [Entamoeba marina]